MVAIITQEDHIPETRFELIAGFPNPVLANPRRKQEYSSRMKQESTLQRSAGPQARIHGISDRQRNHANKAAQGIAGPSVVSMNTDFTFHRSGTGPAGRRAGRVPSLPILAIHPLRQPAIPGL